MAFVDEAESMSKKRQCELLDVPRSSLYHSRGVPSKRAQDELLMREMDEIYLEEPTYGSRRLLDQLKLMGHEVGRDRVRRLMREMGIEPIYSKPRLSQPGKGHKIYPYLLRNLEIEAPGHVWCSDITYIPLAGTHVYLTVVMDWASRYVISWRLSNSLDDSFCVECLDEALLKEPPPEIFNTDQGSQYTGTAFTDRLKAFSTSTTTVRIRASTASAHWKPTADAPGGRRHEVQPGRPPPAPSPTSFICPFSMERSGRPFPAQPY